MAVINTPSLTPFKPRNRNRSSLRMRFIWVNRISTFLRSRRDCWKDAVLANADAIPHVFIEVASVRTIAVVHFGFNEQR